MTLVVGDGPWLGRLSRGGQPHIFPNGFHAGHTAPFSMPMPGRRWLLMAFSTFGRHLSADRASFPLADTILAGETLARSLSANGPAHRARSETHLASNRRRWPSRSANKWSSLSGLGGGELALSRATLLAQTMWTLRASPFPRYSRTRTVGGMTTPACSMVSRKSCD